MDSAIISSFELLFKPIAPASAPINRRVVQAYFLLVSNLTEASAGDVTFALKFTVNNTPLVSDKLITIFDVGVGNNFGNLSAGMSEDYVIPSGYTGLFILQPKDLDPAAPDVEIRGVAEITLLPTSEANSAKLLLTPQQRGTFLPVDPAVPDFDQQAYTLPTPNGSYLFELSK
ncbi:MAG: hypothetical protein Fur0046_02450 [Cyanobacteria bacterium J069]|nr:MAG: hypothetical protein D6742_15220 [Cyanobacteria bacterium J069]